MLIIGAKSFAKEVLEICHQCEDIKNLVFYDDINLDIGTLLFDQFKILKNINEAKLYFETVDFRYTIGIGNPYLRYKLFEKFSKIGGEYFSTISPNAKIGSYDVEIGNGTNILSNAIISNSAKIGKGCILYYNVIVTHDCIVGDFVELSPNATLILAGHNPYNNYNIPFINTFVYRGFYNALMNGVGNNTGLHEDVKNIATTEILDKNTTIIKHDDPSIKDNCSICLENYDQDSIIRKLNCSHIFHKDCIDPWLLKESYKCPICRNDSLPHTHT